MVGSRQKVQLGRRERVMHDGYVMHDVVVPGFKTHGNDGALHKKPVGGCVVLKDLSFRIGKAFIEGPVAELGPAGYVDHVVVEHTLQAPFGIGGPIAGSAEVFHSSVMEKDPVLAEGHGSVVFYQKIIEIFHVGGVHRIVRIHLGDILSGRVGDPVVSCVGYASVLLVKGSDSGILSGIVVAHLRRPVRGPVVHQQDLQVGVGLGKQGLHAVGQIFRLVVDRHDYGNQRFFIHGKPFRDQTIFSGLTLSSYSSELIKPRARTASFRVVFSSKALWAAFAAFS